MEHKNFIKNCVDAASIVFVSVFILCFFTIKYEIPADGSVAAKAPISYIIILSDFIPMLFGMVWLIIRHHRYLWFIGEFKRKYPAIYFPLLFIVPIWMAVAYVHYLRSP